MAYIKNLGIAEDQIKSVDDDPTASRLAAQQKLITKWLKPTAMIPFIVFLIIDFRFFPHSNNWLVVSLGLTTVLWAGVINAYSLYLRITFRCPKCGNRFGSNENCLSCSLPRHAPPPSDDGPMFESLES
jgi:hypothetical protein